MSESTTTTGTAGGDSAEGAAPQRSVVTRGERVPLPRRLVAAALLFAVVAAVLHAMPRPYRPLPTGAVWRLGLGHDHLLSVYGSPPAEPVNGEISPALRSTLQWELRRHRWLGVFRELLLRAAEASAIGCLAFAGLAAGRQYRKERRAIAKKGTLAPRLLHTETMTALDAPPSSFAPAPPSVVPVLETPHMARPEFTPVHEILAIPAEKPDPAPSDPPATGEARALELNEADDSRPVVRPGDPGKPEPE